MVVSLWSKCGVLPKLPAKPQVFTIPGEHNVRKTRGGSGKPTY